MKRFVFLLLFCSCTALPQPEKESFLFSYFTGNGEDGLHLAYSLDGRTWEALNEGASYLAPEVGAGRLMRDPSICQGPDGTFHMVWTTGWGDRTIGYASSKDLVAWTPQKAIPVMEHEPEAVNAWAPELFYEASTGTFHIFWASTIPGRHSPVPTSENEKGYNHRMYRTSTRDFENFTPTEIFFDPDFSVIDAAIVADRWNGGLMMIVKNENSAPPEKNLRVTRAGTVAGGFPVEVSAPITGDYWAEGPAPLYVGDTLYIYFDRYMDKRFGAVRTTDGATWEDVSDQVAFPAGIRHGTAFKVPESVVERLRKADGRFPMDE